LFCSPAAVIGGMGYEQKINPWKFFFWHRPADILKLMCV
jgi:hypothetical protein